MLVLQNAPRRGAEAVGAESLQGLQISVMGAESGTAKFDLTMFVEEQGEQLQVVLEYNTDLFKGESITRLLGYFQALIENIVETPEKEVDSLSMISAEQGRELIEAWS